MSRLRFEVIERDAKESMGEPNSCDSVGMQPERVTARPDDPEHEDVIGRGSHAGRLSPLTKDRE